jgi:membrane associated rhomboid family serine protease
VVGSFVALNLLLGAVASGVDNAAHLGGLLTGTVLGTVLCLLDRSWRPARKRSQVVSRSPR